MVIDEVRIEKTSSSHSRITINKKKESINKIMNNNGGDSSLLYYF